ncbi:hypothetical protein ACIPSA_28780 [Streptomyces sp. NPDC086549]|uniref:hypothetical protein n=1 Tax=Streptomyces sp. NPDC086549 TaxID=3365752 RepID=UPI0037F332B7
MASGGRVAKTQSKVRALRRRLDAFDEDSDVSRVLPLLLAHDAVQLWNAVDRATDLEAMDTLGRLFWARYGAQPKGRRIDDLGYAAAACLPVHRLAPERVPAPLAIVYACMGVEAAEAALCVPHEPQWGPSPPRSRNTRIREIGAIADLVIGERLRRRAERSTRRWELFGVLEAAVLGTLLMMLTAIQALDCHVPVPGSVKAYIVAGLGLVAFALSAIGFVRRRKGR